MMTKAERRELIERIDYRLMELSVGPLAQFPLFGEVMSLTPPMAAAPPQMSKVERANAEKELASKLIAMITDGDHDSLSKVARIVGHFSFGRLEKPRGKDRMHPEHFEEWWATMTFLRNHVDDYLTLTELHERLCEETPVRISRKLLGQWCEKLKFPIKSGKS